MHERVREMIKTGKIESDGFELTYTIEGSGKPALVIGSNVYYPRTFSKNLREHLQLTFADHRGFGNALRPYNDDDFEIDLLLEDIEKIRKHLNLDKFILIGHSGHAYLALEYAKKYPKHVTHVVMIAQSPISNEAAFISADQYFDSYASPERKAAYAESMSKLSSDIEQDPSRRFIHYSLRSGARIWHDYKFDATSLWQDVHVNPEMFDYVWGRLFRELDITKGLDQFNLPVLVILGKHDYWNPPALWEPIQHNFKDLTIRILKKSGHTPQLEEANLFDDVLLNWINIDI